MGNWGSCVMGRIAELLGILRERRLDIGRAAGELLCALPEGEKYRSALETLLFMEEMPGGVLICCAGGEEEILYANRALLRIFQCDDMEDFRALTGNSFRGMVYAGDLERVERSIREQVAAGRYDLDYVEYRVRRRDGQLRWIEDYGHFVRGSRDIYYVFLNDVTDRRSQRLMERALLLNENRQLRSMAEAEEKIQEEYLRRLRVIEGLSANYATILYGELDADRVLPYRLSSRTRAFFAGEDEVRSLSGYLAEYVDTWVHPEERETVGAALNPRAIRGRLLEETCFSVNYRDLQDGEVRYLQLWIMDVGQERRGDQIVMASRGVDEEVHREMEQKHLLAEALEKANQAMAAKDTFLATVSHDMRTPMNAVFGFAALARKNLADPAAAGGYIDRMESSAQQLKDMIERVLEVSAAVTGDAHTQEEACDLCTILREVCDFMLPQAEEKELDFTLDCSGLRHSGIYGDGEKLRQLALYLTNNAVTYTRPGGTVRLTLTERELMAGQYAEYRLEAEDNGAGISPEALNRIFQRVPGERDGLRGIGLGMSIAKSIAEKLGGAVSVRSEVGKGSVFTVTLNFRVQPESPAASPAEVGGPTRRHILLVEDNEINREIATELLQELGYVIDTAENGSVAVEKLRQARPGEYDAVLMDIQMPVMNGWDAARAIRQLPERGVAEVPIVALSANVFESDLRRSAESGMNAHLAKPMDVLEVQKTIEELL